MNNERLLNLAISPSGFIFDPVSGHSFSSNEIGVRIINLLKENNDIETIKDIILDEYDVDDNTLEVDLMDFINSLKNINLIV